MYLCDTVFCNVCGRKICAFENLCARNGLAIRIVITCYRCNKRIYRRHFIQLRLVCGLRCTDKGQTATLNFPKPATKMSESSEVVGECAVSLATASVKAAAEDVGISEGKTITIIFESS
jgi:hypothetical protein